MAGPSVLVSGPAPWRAPLAAQAAFLQATTLDVAVRKPGNVSQASAGHGMQARQFLDSAAAAAPALCAPAQPIGARILGAVQASLACAGCNTNLGIVLLCAPLAAAAQALPQVQAPALAAELARQLAALDVADATAAFAAIALANPGGLGEAPDHDVHAPARIGLREAMAAAAHRDRIARQYAEAGEELFRIGLEAWRGAAGRPLATRVQAVYLGWLASGVDSHIVRKQGLDAAHTVLHAAQGWQRRLAEGAEPDAHPAWWAWDDALKQARINPGTSADLTVATLMLAALLGEP